LPQLNELKPIRPPFSLSHHFRDSAISQFSSSGIPRFRNSAIPQFRSSAVELAEGALRGVLFISALSQLNSLKPIRPPFSFSQQFRNFAVPRSNLLKEVCAAFRYLSIATIERAEAYSPSILYISAISQFRGRTC